MNKNLSIAKFVDISIIFITYNRSHFLKKSFTALKKAALKIGLQPYFIVADDCSSQKHLNLIKKLGFDLVLSAEVNSGLGANQNQALISVSSEYILQLQDDWVIIGNPTLLLESINILKQDASIGIVQLTPVGCDMPFEIRVTNTGYKYKVYKPDRAPWHRACTLRPYSDQPHIKSAHFVNDIGLYLEGVSMPKTENDYKYRVANQGRWRVAQILDTNLFKHIGEEHSLNPGGKENKLVTLLHKIPFLGKRINPALRIIWQKIDHLAAIIASRLLQ